MGNEKEVYSEGEIPLRSDSWTVLYKSGIIHPQDGRVRVITLRQLSW